MEFEIDCVVVGSRLTALHHSPELLHRICYHVTTLAMQPSTGYINGKTYDSHYRPVKVKNPPKQLIIQSKQLIGQKADKFL